MKKPGSSSFESEYPAITRWIKESGRIEIGGSSFADSFVKAVNRDGVLWGGKQESTSIDEALRDMEAGIEVVLAEQARTHPSRTGKPRSKKAPKTRSRADKGQHRSEEDEKLVKKVEKLDRDRRVASPGRGFPGDSPDDPQGPLRRSQGGRGLRPVPDT
jgi:hypothetical protein